MTDLVLHYKGCIRPNDMQGTPEAEAFYEWVEGATARGLVSHDSAGVVRVTQAGRQLFKSYPRGTVTWRLDLDE